MATQVVPSLAHGGVSAQPIARLGDFCRCPPGARPLRGPRGHPEPRSRSRGTQGRCAVTDDIWPFDL